MNSFWFLFFGICFALSEFWVFIVICCAVLGYVCLFRIYIIWFRSFFPYSLKLLLLFRDCVRRWLRIYILLTHNMNAKRVLMWKPRYFHPVSYQNNMLLQPLTYENASHARVYERINVVQNCLLTFRNPIPSTDYTKWTVFFFFGWKETHCRFISKNVFASIRPKLNPNENRYPVYKW